MTSKPEEKLVNFAIDEMKKVLEDLKMGKHPSMSGSMEQLYLEMEQINSQQVTMSDIEKQAWAKSIADKIIKK